MEQVQFDSLFEIPTKNGLSRPSRVRGSGYKMINMGELFANDRIYDIPMELVPMNEKEKLINDIREDDLLFARQSLVLSGAGKCSIVKEVKEYTTFESHLIRVRLNKEIADPNYYYYYFKSPYSPIKSIVQQCAQSGIRASELATLKVCYISLEQQRKIAGILSAYDDLIENNRRQIKLLEEAAQKLYKEWFVKLNFPGHENVKIVDGVPEGWIKTDINSVCNKINAGGTPNRKKSEYWNNKDIKWFKTKELQDCWLYDSEEYISQKGLENSSAKIFPRNTILMAIYASPTLGRLGILTKEACCNQAALCLIANEEIISYQWLYLKLMELRDYFNSVARGAGQQNISADVVKNKTILLPTKSLLDNFTKIIGPYFDKIKSLQNQIQLLQSARDKLLPTLMKGDIDV